MTPGVRLCLLMLFVCAGPAAGADLQRGRLIAHGGGGAGEEKACFRCHGLDGGGDAALAVPKLAGLPAFYLAKQMRDFARGTRPNPIMTPIAKDLGEADLSAVAAYYAGLPMPAAALAQAHDLDLGRRIAGDGVPARNVPPCAACHGWSGESKAPAIPALAGQPARYLALQLHRWRTGKRNNDPLNGMERFATALEPEEIDAVSQWYAAQPAGGGR